MDEINQNIGRKIKELRRGKGLSREYVARKIIVSQQQVERYEKGVNRVPVDRLYIIAKILDKPVSWFLD